MKNVTFKWIIVTIVSIFVLTGCYTKNQAIKKFCKQDTAQTILTIHDTVMVDRIIADTVFSETIDSVIVTKDKLVIKYQKVKGKIKLTGEYKGDTIYTEKIVEVKVPCNCPPEYVPGFWDKVKSWFAVFGVFALVAGIFILGPWNR